MVLKIVGLDAVSAYVVHADRGRSRSIREIARAAARKSGRRGWLAGTGAGGGTGAAGDRGITGIGLRLRGDLEQDGEDWIIVMRESRRGAGFPPGPEPRYLA